MTTNVRVDGETCPLETLLGTLLASGPKGAARESATTATVTTLLASLGGLGGLARATTAEIEAELAAMPRPRIPPRAAARRIVAAIELGRRAATDMSPPALIASSADVASWASARLTPLDHEELWLLALDGRSRVRAVRRVAKGGLHGLCVRAADPLRLALRAAASGFVLVHNHPSGDPTPSREDIVFTQGLAAAAAIVGMPLLDHVVVAREGFASVPFSVDTSSRSEGVEA